MTPIDLKEISERYQIPHKDLALELFPDNRHPRLALKRAMDGITHINATQVIRLAELLGVTPNELFDKKGWSGSYKEGLYTFKKGPYTAHLRMDNGTTRLYKEGTQMAEIILHIGAVTLTDYINQLEAFIS